MEPIDGLFNTVNEAAALTLDLSSLEGQHTLYFQATDTDGYAGPVSAAFVEFEYKEEELSPHLNETDFNGTAAGYLPGMSNSTADEEYGDEPVEVGVPGIVLQAEFSVTVSSESSENGRDSIEATAREGYVGKALGTDDGEAIEVFLESSGRITVVGPFTTSFAAVMVWLIV